MNIKANVFLVGEEYKAQKIELPDYPNILKSGLIDIFPNLSCPETSMYYVFSERKKSSKKIKLLLKYLQAKGK